MCQERSPGLLSLARSKRTHWISSSTSADDGCAACHSCTRQDDRNWPIVMTSDARLMTSAEEECMLMTRRAGSLVGGIPQSPIDAVMSLRRNARPGSNEPHRSPAPCRLKNTNLLTFHLPVALRLLCLAPTIDLSKKETAFASWTATREGNPVPPSSQFAAATEFTRSPAMAEEKPSPDKTRLARCNARVCHVYAAR